MEYMAFLKLCTILHAHVQVEEVMSICRTSMGSITVVIMLHCLLQWLGSGSYIDISSVLILDRLHFIVAATIAFMQFGIWQIRVQTLQKNWMKLCRVLHC